MIDYLRSKLAAKLMEIEVPLDVMAKESGINPVSLRSFLIHNNSIKYKTMRKVQLWLDKNS